MTQRADTPHSYTSTIEAKEVIYFMLVLSLVQFTALQSRRRFLRTGRMSSTPLQTWEIMDHQFYVYFIIDIDCCIQINRLHSWWWGISLQRQFRQNDQSLAIIRISEATYTNSSWTFLSSVSTLRWLRWYYYIMLCRWKSPCMGTAAGDICVVK